MLSRYWPLWGLYALIMVLVLAGSFIPLTSLVFIPAYARLARLENLYCIVHLNRYYVSTPEVQNVTVPCYRDPLPNHDCSLPCVSLLSTEYVDPLLYIIPTCAAYLVATAISFAIVYNRITTKQDHDRARNNDAGQVVGASAGF